MIYIIFGTQDLMIKRRVNRIIKERLEHPDPFNCVQYDLNDYPIQDLVDDATLIPIGVDHKVIVGYNAYFLSGEKSKAKDSQNNYDKLLEYIEYPNDYCDIIFTFNGTKIDKKNKVVDALVEKSQVYELISPKKEEWLQFIDATVEKNKGTITYEAKSELYRRIGDNAYLLNNEIEKLLLNNPSITIDDVKSLITIPLEENVFNILDSLLNKNKSKAIHTYRDLLVKNEEPVRLISVLASQIRIQIDIMQLLNDGLSQNEISKILKIHEFRVQLGINNSRKISLKSLLKELDNLYKLDLDIKESKINRFYGFEMFLINFNRNANKKSID